MITHPLFPANLFSFCPACGEPLADQPGGKNIECTACGFVLYFNSSAAVAGIIVNGDGEVLFTVRRSDPAGGLLDLPGGFVDPGETCEAALVREVYEELHLKVVHMSYLSSFANTYLYKDVLYHTTDAVYICTVDSLEGGRAGDDVSGFVFRNPATVQPCEIGLPSIRAAVERYVTAVSMS